MVSLEQVRLLESKVSKAIAYVKKVTEENTHLKGKLDTYQNRIDELEVLIQQFKEEQSRIEDGILSALDRLNQFEDALENTIAGGTPSEEKAATKGNGSPKKDIPVKEEKKTSKPTEEPETFSEPARSEDEKSSAELDIF